MLADSKILSYAETFLLFSQFIGVRQMIFSNKLKPSEWLPYVEGAAREHHHAQRAVESWMNGVADVGSRKWKEDYNPGLSAPRNRNWNNPLAVRDESKPNLYDFFDNQEKANNFVSQAIAKVGKPKMHVNHWRTYTAALMNQDVSHLALNLAFLSWVRTMASQIHCNRNGIHGGTYEPYLKSLEAIDHYMGVFDDTERFHRNLVINDIYSNNVDLTDGDAKKHVDLVLYERVNRFPILFEKMLAECSSLLPFIVGESAEMDISSFGLI